MAVYVFCVLIRAGNWDKISLARFLPICLMLLNSSTDVYLKSERCLKPLLNN